VVAVRMQLRGARIVNARQLELTFDVQLDADRWRRVSALIEAGPRRRMRSVFPHLLNEMGESLGSELLDGEVKNRGLAMNKLFEAYEVWFRFRRGKR
jgi:hypothetical protein